MLFSSLTFLFYFLPLVLLVYYLIPAKGRTAWLLLSSLVFYAWGGVSYSIILVGSILVNFFLARLLANPERKRKPCLIVGLLFNVSLLFTFKYLAFFITNLNLLSDVLMQNPEAVSAVEIALPIGISFFTFQQVSMLWDIYRSKEKQRIGLLETALYIGFFPQLIAGPIVRYNHIINQIRTRKESIAQFSSGIERFIIGLFKKMVLANGCAEIIDTLLINDVSAIGTSAAWLGAIAYTFQIYFDFSGYSDMAIGLGRMFGFSILENFNFPYAATSIQDFWRRWHISLSSWFRDYVYIPLGGNRLGGVRTYVNLMIVFLLTGFWHGATWSFVFWGVFHGVFLIIERVGFKNVLAKLPKPIRWVYTMFIVVVGWVFFRVEDFGDAAIFAGKLVGIGTTGDLVAISFLNAERYVILALAFVLSFPLIERVSTGQLKAVFKNPAFVFSKQLVLIGLFFYAIVLINSGSYSPFIYFRF